MTKKYSLPALLGLCVLGFALFGMPQLTRSQIVAGPLMGYAWSDTIGWIDLNCQNLGDCSPSFGLSVDADGNVTGLAWSEHIGWVSARPGDLSGCPQSPCTARLSGSNFSGWLRAVSGGSAQSGGWDGFISLSGPGYGVSGTGGNLAGFGWGSIVVGWTQFLLQGPEAEEEEQEEENGENNEGENGEEGEENQCVPTTSFCVGNTIQNNCGDTIPCPLDHTCEESGATAVCIPPPIPVLEIRAVPSLVASNSSARITWSATAAVFCSVTEDNPEIVDTWTDFAGSEFTSPLTQRTRYTLTCEAEDGTIHTKSTTINILPIFQET